MSGYGRRVRHERDLWKAVWLQMETFLDRVDGAADQDESHVVTLCQLMPVLNVIEAARSRVLGDGLKPAWPVTPGGGGYVMHPARAPEDQLPGLEELEFAAAAVLMPNEDTVQLVLWPTEILDVFRDSKRYLEGARKVPGYENGTLYKDGNTAFVDLGDIVDDGLFSKGERENAANGEEYTILKWSTLRENRRAALPQSARDAQVPISTQLADLTYGVDPIADFQAVGVAAGARAAACTSDRNILAASRVELAEVGADTALIGALSACEAQLASQATEYTSVATSLSYPALNQLGTTLPSVRSKAAYADFLGGIGLSPAFLNLDAQSTKVFDTECDARIAYPDGPLRQLRLLEQGLRFFWKSRKKWIEKRTPLITAPIMLGFWDAFTTSFTESVAGRWSGLTLPGGTVTTQPINARATAISVTGIPPLDTFRPGRLAKIGGDRPAVAVVTDEGFDTRGLYLTTTPIELSLSVEEGVPGTAGLVPPGATLTTTFPIFTAAEWYRGKANSGEASDALITGLVAHASRLALLLGAGVAGDRPAAPTVPRPYPGLTSFALEGPVTSEAARLFLSAVPAASASGTGERLGIARPGELMLIRGVDEEGLAWQGVAEIDSCEILTGEQARADDAITGTPVPPCCEDKTEVMVVTLRQLQIPATLVSQITLHRDFLGFGSRSLLAAAILPLSLDPATVVPSISVDGTSTLVLRDHELKAAVAIFESWIGRDTGAKS